MTKHTIAIFITSGHHLFLKCFSNFENILLFS